MHMSTGWAPHCLYNLLTWSKTACNWVVSIFCTQQCIHTIFMYMPVHLYIIHLANYSDQCVYMYNVNRKPLLGVYLPTLQHQVTWPFVCATLRCIKQCACTCTCVCTYTHVHVHVCIAQSSVLLFRLGMKHSMLFTPLRLNCITLLIM